MEFYVSHFELSFIFYISGRRFISLRLFYAAHSIHKLDEKRQLTFKKERTGRLTFGTGFLTLLLLFIPRTSRYQWLFSMSPFVIANEKITVIDSCYCVTIMCRKWSGCRCIAISSKYSSSCFENPSPQLVGNMIFRKKSGSFAAICRSFVRFYRIQNRSIYQLLSTSL